MLTWKLRWIVIFLYVPYLFAATPKFNIVANSVVQRTVAPNETVFVSYRVTNQTKLTRTLTLVPITGVSQLAIGSFCPSPFTLSPGASCQLRLKIEGSLLPASGIHGGPEVCKTQWNSNAPDPFLCSQAAPQSQLNMNKGDGTTINAFPNPLYVDVSNTGTVTVQNTGSQAATNLQVSVTPGSITVSNQCGATLSAGGTCTIQLSSAGVVDGTLTVEGDNTNTENVSVHFVNSGGNNIIAITSPIPSLRIIPLDGTLALTLINNGPTAATNIALGSVVDCPNVTTAANTCGASLAVGNTCQLTLASPTPYVACLITITGSNVVPLQTYVAFQKTVPSSNTPGVSISGLVYKIDGAQAYMLTNQDPAGVEGLAPWWNGSPDTLVGASSLFDGASNTTTILQAWTPSGQDIAAAVCQNQPLDSNWYLPAFCELSGDASVCMPATENVQTNLFDKGFYPELKTGANGTGTYWSSTEINTNTAWGQRYANGVTAGSQLNKDSSYGVRCAMIFSF